MATYRVVFEYDVIADSAREAAELIIADILSFSPCASVVKYSDDDEAHSVTGPPLYNELLCAIRSPLTCEDVDLSTSEETGEVHDGVEPL